MKQSDMLDNSVQVRDTLTITTSQKYEACTRQTLGLQRQTTSCSDATCPLLVAYDLNTSSPTDSCTDTNTPLKHILPTRLLFMYRIKRQTVSQSGERHFVRRDWMCSNIDKKSLGCKKPVGRTLLPATGWGKRQVPRRPARWDRGQSIKRLCELLKNYWPVVRNLRRLVFCFFCLSHSFAPSPGFSESSGGRLLMWWESFPGTGREMSMPA